MTTKKTPPIKPVYYFYGDEDYQLEEAVKAIKGKVLYGGFESMNYHVYYGKTLEVSELVNTARTMPAFCEMRLLLIKEAGSLNAARKKELAEYVKNPSESSCLIFITAGSKPDRASAVYKHLMGKGAVKEFKRLAPQPLRQWIKDFMGKQDKTITDAAIDLLTTLTEGRLRDVRAELDKLVLFTGDRERVGDADVQDCSIDVRDESAFDLADAIATKSASEAFRILANLESDSPVQIIGALAWHFRSLIKVKSGLEQGVSASQLPGKLRLSRRNVERYVRSAGNFSSTELLSALCALGRADTDIKSGRMSGSLVLSGLVMELALIPEKKPARSERA